MKLRRLIRTLYCSALLAAGFGYAEHKAQAQDGNSLSNAIPLGRIGMSINRNGTLTAEDPVDYYHFKVEGSVRAVRLVVPGIDPNAVVRLLRWPVTDADPIVLARSDSSRFGGADFTLWLDPGDYYIQVESSSNNRSYTLQLSQIIQEASKGNSDNRLSEARDLGSITTSLSLADYVGTADEVDYFRFRVEGSVRAIRIVVPGIDPNAIIRLLRWPVVDADPIQLAASDSSRFGGADFTLWLDPGEYFIQVGSASQNRVYNLQISQIIQADSKGNSDNRLSDARDLGSITTGLSLSDYVGTADEIDYFRFQVEDSVRAVRVVVPGVDPNALVTLLRWPVADADPIQLAAANSSRFGDADFTLWLDPGEYFIEVVSAAQNRIYNLQLSQSNQPDSKGNSDNRISTARDLGSVTTALSLSEYVGTADEIDYIRFQVKGTARMVRIVVPGIDPNAVVRLLSWAVPDADPIQLVRSDSNRFGAADIRQLLEPGFYFIEVSSDAAVRPYTLQLSQTLPDKTPPFIMLPLEHVTVTSGQAGVLSVGAEGSSTLSYQWSFNGTPIPGATSPQLQIDGATAAQAGSYSVTVTSEFGSVTSTAATLTVTPPSLALDIAPAVIISWPVVAEGLDIAQWILDRGTSVNGPWIPATPVVRTIANDRVHFAVPVERADNVVFRLRRP